MPSSKKRKRPSATPAAPPYPLTPEQKQVAKELHAKRDGCLTEGAAAGRHGQMLVGPPGVGKTAMVGEVNRKKVGPKAGAKILNLFVTANPKQAEAQVYIQSHTIHKLFLIFRL